MDVVPCSVVETDRQIGKGAPGAHSTWSLLGSKAGVDAADKKKIFRPCRKPKPGGLAWSLANTLTELPTIINPLRQTGNYFYLRSAFMCFIL
jgi:hypothetical protein